LSTIKNVKEFEYSFEKEAGIYETVTGRMTNEAPAKAVIRQLCGRNRKERLDRIVMICSDAVYQTVDSEEFQGLSHVEAYKKMINDFAKMQDDCYVETPIEYVEVSIPNFTEDREVSKAVIDAANKVIECDDAIHLHIDYNGGQRYVAFMILAIANLMKIRHVDIRQIMTMNFESNHNKIIPIQNMMPVFGSFDLVSGINEYINYGRIKGLRNYFKISKNEEIESLLNKMEVFANNLQLCRTGYILKEKANLLKYLQEYIIQERETLASDTYEQMFMYVVKDILEGYKGLLDGELPDVIKWCVERDFIQQALTFCAEELPDYLWKQNLYTASKGEKKEYLYFLERLQETDNSKYRRLKSDYKNGMTETSSKFAYNWLVKYLTFSCELKEYEELCIGMEDGLYKKGPETEELEEIKNLCKKAVRNAFADMKLSNSQLYKATSASAKYIWQRANGRVGSQKVKKDELCEIITLYFLLKEQRNATNHANGGDGSGEEWSYHELYRVLIHMANILLKIREK